MMPLFLKIRDRSAMEFMDDPECDPELLAKTYRHFKFINLLLSRWIKIYRQHILPFARDEKRAVTVLDIGFGGGDILRNLAEWSARDGINVQLTGIETDRRALSYVHEWSHHTSIRFLRASPSDLLGNGVKFDFVISNHLLHHLADEACLNLMEEAIRLSHHKVLFNDIERSDTGYLLFNLLKPMFYNSFIIPDGLTSIRRSFTSRELRKLVPGTWQVFRLFPYRLLLLYQHERN